MTPWFKARGRRLRTQSGPAMRATCQWFSLGLAGLGFLLLASCAEQVATISPSETLALLRTGRAPLTCGEPCLAQWQAVQPQAAQLLDRGRWRDLATLVLQTRYGDDLSLYYLGRAAEGVGYRPAAASYYRQSMRISGTSGSCQYLSRVCGGIALPRAASVRVAAIERAWRRARYRRAPGPPTPVAPAPEAAAPAPPATPVTPPESDYIEPPPVEH